MYPLKIETYPASTPWPFVPPKEAVKRSLLCEVNSQSLVSEGFYDVAIVESA